LRNLQIDNRHQKDPILSPKEAVKLCDRNFGIGGDGVSPQSMNMHTFG
jgi:diaminopimelate epimerase